MKAWLKELFFGEHWLMDLGWGIMTFIYIRASYLLGKTEGELESYI